jgi:hypothetical protein
VLEQRNILAVLVLRDQVPELILAAAAVQRDCMVRAIQDREALAVQVMREAAVLAAQSILLVVRERNTQRQAPVVAVEVVHIQEALAETAVYMVRAAAAVLAPVQVPLTAALAHKD